MKNTLESATATERFGASRLPLLFVVAYIAHGLSSQFGLIAQPMQFFMKSELHMTAAEVSSCLAIMMLPWVLKPFYGIFCDFVPLFGYRRKSYLIAANAITCGALLTMACTQSLNVLMCSLMVTAVGMAASTAVTVGMAVEAGRKDKKADDFFSMQTFCYYSAIIVASIVGGRLCQYLAPTAALSYAALAAAIPVFAVSLIGLFFLQEERSQMDLNALRNVFSLSTLRSPALLMVALFIWFWDFSPSFGVPLYYFETNSLHFSQGYIGQLAAWNAAGMVIGSIAYRYFVQKQSVNRQLWLTITMGTLSTLAYLLLSSPASAVVLEVFRGSSNMIAVLLMYSLAARVCPVGGEVFTMASLIAVKNLATEGSTFLGGQLYDRVFDGHLQPLILIAACATAACALLIPWLNRHTKPAQT